MQKYLIAALTSLGVLLLAGAAQAQSAEEAVRAFLATVTPPGARITFGALETAGTDIELRDVVAHSESAAGEEMLQRIGRLQLQGLRARGDGLFTLDRLFAENIRINGTVDLQLASVAASSIDGARIAQLALSGVRIDATAGASKYNISIKAISLRDVDAAALGVSALRAQTDPDSTRMENALLNTLLNTQTYGALSVRRLAVRQGADQGVEPLLLVAEMGIEPDGLYVPFPASGHWFVRNAQLNLRYPPLAALRQRLAQDNLQFDFDSRHGFAAPGKHRWDIKIKLAPDGVFSGACTAENLSGFSPALIRQAQAASGSPAVLRRCDMSFAGKQFINGWLARNGAANGLSAEQARGKYLALALYAPFDPQLAGDPLTVELAEAAQIFLSQPSRLNILIKPEGGLKFPDGLLPLGLLFHGAPEQKRQAAQQLGISVTASPLAAP